MSFNVVDNRAIINGGIQKGAAYGKEAAKNHFGYINSLASTQEIKPDVFTKGATTESIEQEAQKLQSETFTPVNFLLRYAPKKGFFAKLFSGKIDKQALLGYTAQTMGGKGAVSVEEMDKELNEAFKDTGAKLTSKAFDVNGDGMIDVSENAVSTVLADVLSKGEAKETITKKDIKLKKADGSYTNEGENRMMAFCNEKNTEEAAEIVKKVYSTMGLDKAGKLYTTQG